MKKRNHLFLLFFMAPIMFWSCQQNQYPSRINIDEDIYLSDEGKEKIEKYLSGLEAQSASLDKESYLDYEIFLTVENSRKMAESQSDKQDWISQTLARVITDALVYPDDGMTLNVKFNQKQTQDRNYIYSIDSILLVNSLTHNLPGDAFQSQLEKAQVAYQNFDFEETIGHLNNVIDYHPEWVEALELRAQAFTEMEEYEYAREDYETLKSLNDSNYRYYYRLAEVGFAMNLYAFAQEKLDTVIMLTDSMNTATFILKGNIAMENLEMDQAEIYFHKAVELAPKTQEVWLARREYYLKKDDDINACHDLIEASKLGPLSQEESLALKICAIYEQP
ncbi:MAG: hypothetical protein R3B93_29110 [Bacteroidia bacterium]